MTPRSTFALALCAYIAATGASLYTSRRGGAEERSTPSGRAAASYIRSETAAASEGTGGSANPKVPQAWPALRKSVVRLLARTRDSGTTVRERRTSRPSRYPRVIRWRTLVERVLAEQEER